MIKWVRIKEFRDTSVSGDLEGLEINNFGRVNIFLCDEKQPPYDISWVSKLLQAIFMPEYLRSKINLFPVLKCNIKSNMFEVEIDRDIHNIRTSKNYSACYVFSPDLLFFHSRDKWPSLSSINEFIANGYVYYAYEAPEKIVGFDNFRGVSPIVASNLSEHMGSYSKKQFFISSFDENFIANLICKTPKKELRVFYGTKKLNNKQIEEIISTDCFLLNLDKIVSS